MKKNSLRLLLLAVFVTVFVLLAVSCNSTAKHEKVPEKISVDLPASGAKPVSPAVEPIAEKTPLEYTMNIQGQTAKAVFVAPDSIRVEYPTYISKAQIEKAIPELYKTYEYYLAGSVYSIKDSALTLKLAYNITEEEFSKYVPFAEGVINDYVIESIKAQEEKARTFKVKYNNDYLSVKLTEKGSVEISFPKSITIDDFFSAAEMAEKKYPAALQDATVLISETGSVVINFGRPQTFEAFVANQHYYQEIFDEYAAYQKKNAVSAVVKPVVETVAKVQEKAESAVAKLGSESAAIDTNIKKETSSVVSGMKEKVKDVIDKVDSLDTGEVKSFAKSIPATANKVAQNVKPKVEDFFSFLCEIIVKYSVIAYEWVIANPLYAGIGAFVLVVVIILLARSHKNDDEDEE